MDTKPRKTPRSNRRSIGKPFPLIEWVEWLRHYTNLRRYWLPILIACIVGSAWLLFETDIITRRIIDQRPDLPQSRPETERATPLPEDQTRRMIREALHEGDVGRAASLLSGLSDDHVKREECEHIFEFCVKNGELDDAERIAGNCWDGDERKEKLARVALERLKQ